MNNLARATITAKYENQNTWVDMFEKALSAPEYKPRSMIIKELLNFTLTVDPLWPFMNFSNRKLNIPYIKKELLWKLSADPHNDSIKQHAKIWQSTQNSDGTFNSNYGQYWFGKQLGLQKAFNELVKDKDSRRAIIPMLNDSHLGPAVTDTVCTESVGFFIRDYKLHMIVHMRSSDQIFGLGTDIPTFAFLHRLMIALVNSLYQSIEFGTLSITAMSSHIYAKHFDMVSKIVEDPSLDLDTMFMPVCDYEEALKLITSGGNVKAEWGELSEWLLS